MANKFITFSSQSGLRRSYLLTNGTKAENLESLIRSDFMLCPEAKFKIFDQLGNHVSLDQLVSMSSAERDRYTDSFVITADRTLPYYVSCDAHSVLLRGAHKNSSMLHDPIQFTDVVPGMPVSVMHVNLPMHIQLRQMPAPRTDRSHFLLELQVNAEFGISSAITSLENKTWSSSSFKLKIRAHHLTDVVIRPYSHSPSNEISETATTERSNLGNFVHHAKEKLIKSSAPSSCTYNPHAYHTVVNRMVDGERSTQPPRLFAWNGKQKPPIKMNFEDGFMEWVVEYDKDHRSSIVTEKSFVQTFQFECDPYEDQPLRYEFDVIGELTAYHSDSVNDDEEAFRVVQHEIRTQNPGFKRIAAVQCNRICVDVYQQSVQLVCYKHAEEPQRLSAKPVFIQPKQEAPSARTDANSVGSPRGTNDISRATASTVARQFPQSHTFMDSEESPRNVRNTVSAVRFQDTRMSSANARADANTATNTNRNVNASTVGTNANNVGTNANTVGTNANTATNSNRSLNASTVGTNARPNTTTTTSANARENASADDSREEITPDDSDDSVFTLKRKPGSGRS